MQIVKCSEDVSWRVKATKQQRFFLEMLLFLITALSVFGLYFTDLPSTLWLNLFSAYDFVVRYADPIEVHYIVQ